MEYIKRDIEQLIFDVARSYSMVILNSKEVDMILESDGNYILWK